MKNFFALLFCLLISQIASAQSSATGPHIKVALLSEHSGAAVGKQQWLGVLLSPENEWHTYWRNAGDSGEPPTVAWQTNADVEFGEIQWPIPEQIPVAHLVNYGYSGDILLMVPYTVNTLPSGGNELEVTADLSWLVCKEDCIPGWATLSIELPLADNPELSNNANLFEITRERLPSTQVLSAQYEITEDYLTLSVTPPTESNWQLLPFRADLIQHNSEQQWLSNTDSEASSVVLAKSDYFSLINDTVDFLLTDGEQGFYLNATINQGVVDSHTNSLALLLAFAFIGGLILNIMPCVLPVLSLKAMALASNKAAGSDSGSKDFDHWGYLVGILVSFWLFAGLILFLKASGDAIGWGFHLQEPLVIAGLSFLFLFIALMLWDVAPTGAGLSGIGQSLTQGNSFTSQFFTGVLAVIVASPCTAPFMATALGVAMVSPAIDTVLIFTALALGFALPMTLLSFSPKFASFLPKPGAWMETFKHFLAFPMLATVVWLLWVFLGQTSSLGQLWLLSGLLIFAMFVWVASKFGSFKSIISFAFALLIAGYSSYQATEFSSQTLLAAVDNFSEQKLMALRKEEQVVVVNMTADWCITCKVNEQVAFSDSDLQQVLNKNDVTYVVGDWTNKNQEILNYLTRYQRSGVPLYVVYAGTQSEQILPQVLTPKIVLDAIEKAQQELNNAKG